MKIVLLSIVLVLVGCATQQSVSTLETDIVHSDTMEIIRRAAESAPNGVLGEYIFEIKAVGNQGPFIYLNSELDYRDQRAVTVAIHPRIMPLFIQKYGVPPQEYFVGKIISVAGEAKRIRIDFNSQGKPTGKYYYQTHIRVTDISQIKVVDGHA
jgi:hypothetical protein